MKIKAVLCLALVSALGLLLLLHFTRSSPPAEVRSQSKPAVATPRTPPPGGLDAPMAAAPPPATPPPGTAPVPSAGGPFAATAARWEEAPPEAAFAAFNEWVTRYQNAPTAADKAALEAEGVRLAQVRRTALAELIQHHPERALQLALPAAVRDGLPDSVTGWLEESVTGRGDYQVLAVRPRADASQALPPVVRAAQIDGVPYEVFTYGPGLTYITRADVPLNGIALDVSAASQPPTHPLVERRKLLALDPTPARLLESAALKQALRTEPLCAISGQPTETAVQLGTQIRSFCGKVHAEDWANAGIAASGLTVPSGAAPSGLPTAESSYTEGRKRMLLMRPIWSNYNAGMDTNNALTHFQNFSNYMYEMSQGKLMLAPLGRGSEVTPPMLLPGLVAEYDNTGLGKLYNTCRDVAQNTFGYDLTEFDFTYVCTAGAPAADYAGLAFVGGVGFHLANSYWDPAVSCHEYGHNLGLNHAHFWDTGLRSMIGSGVNVEYGDNNDPMGGGGSPNSYNSRYKNYLGWILDSDIADLNVRGSGVYRLYAFDLDNSVGLRGLKFRRNASQNYWINFRQRKTSKKALMNGVQTLWTGNGNEGSYLVDVNLKGSADDNAVVIGRTFGDPGLQFYFTPLGKGHTFPESMDVRVNLGPFPGNLPPTVAVTSDLSSASAGQTVTFTATANDPNGDPLAYAWEFGDGDYSTDNSAVTTHSFAGAGEYAVQCTASDMKGGAARHTVIIRVGSPSTFRLSGHVLDSANRALVGVRVQTDTGRAVYTDSDGSYTLTGLAAGSYSLEAIEPVLGAYAFVHPSFNNPVRLGPSVTGIDFLGVSSSQTTTTPLLARSAASWKYLDTGVDQGTAWRAPSFVDSAWPNGTAPLGYPSGSPITTVISFGPNSSSKYVTYYFRRQFTVNDPTAYVSVLLETLRDDGVVLYLNGVEAYRNNMPSGTIGFSTLASSRIDADVYLQTSVSPTLLVQGVNTLAAEVHQGDVTSSDITFDAAVSGLSVAGGALQLFYLSSPADHARYTVPAGVPLSATAFTTAGDVTLVEYFVDGGKIGEDNSEPFGMIWNQSTPGTYQLSARATLSGGGVLNAPAVTVTLAPPATPSVEVLNPTNGYTAPVPAALTLQAKTVAAGVTVSSVQYYVDGVLVGAGTAAPYSVSWVGTGAGDHNLVAVMRAGGGASYTSAPVALTLTQPDTGQALISFGEVWKYLDDGSDQGTAWAGRSFDDRMWSAGPARLGYGSDGEVTSVSFGTNSSQRFPTTYFRKRFVVPIPALYSRLVLRLVRDDGAVVYLNGTEVARDNMLPGAVSWNSLAAAAADGAAESTPVVFTVNPSLLSPGTNVIAVEVHQVAPNNNDLGFDLALSGVEAAGPPGQFYLSQPVDGARFTTGAVITLSSYYSGPPPVRVDYYADGNQLGAGGADTLRTFLWSNAPIGSHALTAVADLGTSTQTTDPVSITVNPRPATIQPFYSSIISPGATWKYFDSASPVAVGWTALGFDDSGWPSGPARFGWGLDGERTGLTEGRTTAYFRRAFSFPNPGVLSELVFLLARDDGAVVYLNGVELFRSNMPGGPVTPTTPALSSVNTPDETIYFEYSVPVSGSGILPGANIVAVELHQSSASSSDAGFDLQLQLYGTTEPRVYLTRPVEGATYSSSSNLVNLEAIARGAGGIAVTNVEFFADDIKIGESQAAPFRLSWANAPLGPHHLRARSSDQSGLVSESPEVHVAVGRSVLNTTLIQSNAVWKYLVSGVNIGTSWTGVNYNDASWPAGAARLGYGNDGEQTPIGFGGNQNNKFITTYFRKSLVVSPGAVYTNLTFQLVRDDGAVVWLNGRELYRSNMPLTPITYQTLSSTSVGGTDEQTFFVTTLGTTNLNAGTNVIAVEMHQSAPDSSDLGFNLELTASGYIDEVGPPRLSIALADGAIEFTWPSLEPGYVVVEAPNLDTPGNAWTAVSGSLVVFPGRFVFTAPQPPAPRFYRLRK
jgi:hypothetical protein